MKSILNISESFNIGIHALAILARQRDKKFTVRELSILTESSVHHLSKVMQRLSKNSVVSSVIGPKGGYYLLVSPEDTTLMHIYEVIERKFETSDCLFGQPVCSGGSCIMGNLLHKINSEVYNYFINTKLSDLAKI